MAQQVSFRKGSASPLEGVTSLAFGAAWDGKTKKQSRLALKLSAKTGGKLNLGGGTKEVDLDAAAVAYRDGDPKRVVIGHNPNCVPGITHSGDNQTGAGDGDDEIITVDFNALPAWVTEIAIVVAAYKVGTSFASAQNVEMNVYGDSDRRSLVDQLMPTLGRNSNATVVAVLRRNLNANGDPIDGWTSTLVDKSGTMNVQGEDDALVEFVRHHGGVTAR